MSDTFIHPSEKRRFPRLSRKIPIVVGILTYPLPDSDGEPKAARDISGGGIRLTSATPFAPRTPVNIKVDLSGWQAYRKPHAMVVDYSDKAPLTAIGEIVWCEALPGDGGFDVGIRFLDIFEDDRRALIAYLQDSEA